MRAGIAARTVAAMAVTSAFACAQPQQPPGGVRDVTPPRVVDTSPAPFTTKTDLRAPVVIRFDERLSERLEGVRDLSEAVLVSPRTGEVRVDRRRREIRVAVAGGWQPGLVYRVEVLPVIRDLFGNRRTESVELVFSTGAPIAPTALAGFLEDRITGRPVPNGRVEAVRRLDGITYLATSDTAGFFAMRHIPAGAYDITAWLDLNRDGAPAFQEPQAAASAVLGFQDTVVVEMSLLPRDSTPARLARAEAVDSNKVRLLFDDYFAPGPVPGRATLYRLSDSALVAMGELHHATRLDSLRAVEQTAADSLRQLAQDAARDEAVVGADTVAPVDTLATPEAVERPELPRPGAPPAGPPIARPQDPTRPPIQATGRPRDTMRPLRRPLPARELIALLPEPLAPGVAYYVVVDGVTNIAGVVGGGGTVRFQVPPRPAAAERPPGAPPAVAPESPDTVPLPDTVPPPPDARAAPTGRAGR